MTSLLLGVYIHSQLKLSLHVILDIMVPMKLLVTTKDTGVNILQDVIEVIKSTDSYMSVLSSYFKYIAQFYVNSIKKS